MSEIPQRARLTAVQLDRLRERREQGWAVHYPWASSAVLTDEVLASHAEIANLKAEIERLRERNADLENKQRGYCVYCGEVPREPGPGPMAAHVESCEKHPLHIARRERDEARAEVERLRETIAIAAQEEHRSHTQITRLTRERNDARALLRGNTHRCEGCGEYMPADQVDDSDGHTMSDHDATCDGGGELCARLCPVPVHCGPVRAIGGDDADS